MADKLGETFKGSVTGVQSFGLFVELDDVYVQGLVHVSSMSDDYYQFSEKAHTMKGDRTGKAYRLGDRVEVQVARVDLEMRKIDFALADVIQRTAASGPARHAGAGVRPAARRPAAAPRATERKGGKGGKGGKTLKPRRRAPRRGR